MGIKILKMKFRKKFRMKFRKKEKKLNVWLSKMSEMTNP